ncbi:hypothetical protein ISCGN_017547 [Ixodes scapularis]
MGCVSPPNPTPLSLARRSLLSGVVEGMPASHPSETFAPPEAPLEAAARLKPPSKQWARFGVRRLRFAKLSRQNNRPWSSPPRGAAVTILQLWGKRKQGFLSCDERNPKNKTTRKTTVNSIQDKQN